MEYQISTPTEMKHDVRSIFKSLTHTRIEKRKHFDETDTISATKIPRSDHCLDNSNNTDLNLKIVSVKSLQCKSQTSTSSQPLTGLASQPNKSDMDSRRHMKVENIIESNKKRAGIPKRKVTDRVEGLYEVECLECNPPTYHKDNKGLKTHTNCVPKKCHCAFCNKEFKVPKLKNHVKFNQCAHLPQSQRSDPVALKMRKCDVESCSFCALQWEQMVAHIRKNHPALSEEFRFPTEVSTDLSTSHQPKDIIPTKSSIVSSTNDSSLPVLEAKEIMTSLINAESAGRIQIETIKHNCKQHDFEGVKRVVLEEWGIFTSFPTFIKFIHSTRLADAGAVVIDYTGRIPTFRQDKKMLDKFDAVRIKKLYTQTICGTYLNDKIIRIRLTEENNNITIREFAENCFMTDVGTPIELCYGLMANLAQIWNNYDPQVSGTINDTFFEPNQEGWDLGDLDNDLTKKKFMSFAYNDGSMKRLDIPGITTSTISVGKYRTVHPFQKNDHNLHRVIYIHYGASKMWFIIRPEDARRVESKLANICTDQSKQCTGFLRHKNLFLSAATLDELNIPYSTVCQSAKQYIVIVPGSYYQAINLGFNLSEETYAHTAETFHHFKMDYYVCYCNLNPIILPRNNLMGKYQKHRYDLFVEGKDVDCYPDSDQPIIALNDYDRHLEYQRNNMLCRRLDGHQNPVTDDRDEDRRQAVDKSIARLNMCMTSRS